MSFAGARFCRYELSYSLLGLMTVFSLSISAQQPGGGAKVVQIQPEDWTSLQNKFKEKSGALDELRRGTADPKENQDAIDIAAQFYSYQVTWPKTQAVTSRGGNMDTAFTDFEKEIQIAVKAKAEAFLKVFAEKMTKYCKDVMDNNSKVIARINCARMLARLADAGLDETADVLIDEVNKSDQFEAVKYYALKGLRGLVAASTQPKTTVFNGPKGWPEDRFVALRDVVVAAHSGTVTVAVSGLPSGDYAVSIAHDVNKNHKVDRNWLGIPKEQWGMSNNPRPSLKVPSFAACKFSLMGDMEIHVKMQ